MAWSKTPASARGYGSQHRKNRAYLLASEPLCRECAKAGRVSAAKIADHVIPLSRGGSNDLANLQPLCKECSDQKTQREAAEARGATYRPKLRIGLDGWPE